MKKTTMWIGIVALIYVLSFGPAAFSVKVLREFSSDGIYHAISVTYFWLYKPHLVFAANNKWYYSYLKFWCNLSSRYPLPIYDDFKDGVEKYYK